MRSVAWKIDEQILATREKIWRYLTPSSGSVDEQILVAGAVLDWPHTSLEEVARVQFLLSPEVASFLGDLPRLLRQLTVSSEADEQIERSRLTGPVRWGPTSALQAATGDRTLHVTAPTSRIYQTPENEVLVSVLHSIRECGRTINWTSGRRGTSAAARIEQVVADANFWRESRMLAGVNRVALSGGRLNRARRGRARGRYASTIAAYDAHRSLVADLDRQSIKKAIEENGLATQEPSVIFELLCLFDLIDAIEALGWTMYPLRAFRGKLVLKGVHTSSDAEVVLRYQTLSEELATASRYQTILREHHFARAMHPRPDFVLEVIRDGVTVRRGVIECKLSQSMGVAHAARQALTDLMAYRHSFDDRLDCQGNPYGIGIAWGHGLRPNPGSEVAMCTPDELPAAVEQFLIGSGWKP